MKANPIIVALDVEDAMQAREIVDRLEGSVDFYKVGMELYAGEGMTFVRELLDRGKRVFLDLKLYDIGETVRRAVVRIAKSDVTFLTVHGSGAVMRAAAEGRRSSKLQLLGVTVLTSFDEQDLKDLGYPCSPGELVALRALNAMAAGLDGAICSALDVSAVREIMGASAVLVCPGVRSRLAESGDQKRVATPAEAVAGGADYVVVGRQVTRAKDPAAEVDRILGELGI